MNLIVINPLYHSTIEILQDMQFLKIQLVFVSCVNCNVDLGFRFFIEDSMRKWRRGAILSAY